MSGRFISSSEFAGVLGIHRRKARDALRRMAAGEPFAPRHLGKGAAKQVLPVQRLAGLAGGAGGERFAIDPADIPSDWIRHPELLAELAGRAGRSTALIPYRAPKPPATVAAARRDVATVGGAPLDAPAEAETIRAAVGRISRRHEQLTTVAEFIIARTPPHSRERRELVHALAGAVAKLSSATIQKAVKEFQEHGTVAPRKRRSDKGKTRVQLSRAFDRFAEEVGVPAEQLPHLAEKVRATIRGGWIDPHGAATGWRSIRDNIGSELRGIFAAFGVSIPLLGRRQLERLIPPNVVKAELRYRDAAVWKHDAGRAHNRLRVPLNRTIDGIAPGQIVCMDAKVCDITIQCSDRVTSIKAVACMDVRTGWMVADLIEPEEPRRSVRRSDAQLVLARFCRDFAIPETMLRDNGSEYDTPELYAEIGAIVRSGLTGERAPLRENPEIKAKPYQPGSKPIEAGFKRLQTKFLELLPGAHGGHWSEKRTERQGRPPTPYPGTFAELRKDFRDMIRLLNEDTPYVTGERAGKTPRELVEEAMADGWRASAKLLDDEVGFVFSLRETRTVQPGGLISFDGFQFRHVGLASHAWIRKMVEVRWPLVGKEDGEPPEGACKPLVIHVVDPRSKRRICVAECHRDPFIGEEGLMRRRQIDSEQKQAVAALRRGAEPYDVYEGAKARLATLSDPLTIPSHATARAVPDGPADDAGQSEPGAAAEIVALDAPAHLKKREREARKAAQPVMAWEGTMKRYGG